MRDNLCDYLARLAAFRTGPQGVDVTHLVALIVFHGRLVECVTHDDGLRRAAVDEPHQTTDDDKCNDGTYQCS